MDDFMVRLPKKSAPPEQVQDCIARRETRESSIARQVPNSIPSHERMVNAEWGEGKVI